MERGIPPDQGPRYGRHVSTPRAGLADVIAFSDAAEFETWLADHVDERRGVWLKIAKKGSGAASLTGDEAVDVAACAMGGSLGSARPTTRCTTCRSTFRAGRGADGPR
jgi:hypothetical protein